jgi:cytochrome c biogenesis protein CcmG, thiol:disulfide interchange protein DsbE
LTVPNTSSKKLLTVVIGLWAGVCLGIGIIGVLVVTGVIPLLESPTTQGAAALSAEESGEAAPNFELPDLDGNIKRLSDYKGQVVVLNFWATWCGPCVREMPMFQAFQERYPEMALLGVDEEESPETVRDFIQKMGLTYTILLDEKARLGSDLRVNYLPTTFFIDGQGEIRFRHYGSMSEEQLTHYLTELEVIQE